MSSKARLVITAVVLENRPIAEVVRDFGVSRSWFYELLARYRAEGEAAFEPRSRRPLLDRFVQIYNQHRPHRSLPHRATPATAYTARPKAAPGTRRVTDTHDRVRTDKIDKSGTVTLRVAGNLRHIGIGRPHAGTHVILLVQDHVRVVHAATGELLRDLDIDLTSDYQPRGRTTPQ